MQNFVSLWSSLFTVVCDFLISEPIVWFVGVFILILLCSFLQKLLNFR